MNPAIEISRFGVVQWYEVTDSRVKEIIRKNPCFQLRPYYDYDAVRHRYCIRFFCAKIGGYLREINSDNEFLYCKKCGGIGKIKLDVWLYDE